ncbi:MAG: hypothetical protein ACI865_002073 [Flavobacteriaceae bacterium]|jgi:hypothetical protein
MIKYLMPLATLFLLIAFTSCESSEEPKDEDPTEKQIAEPKSNEELEAYLVGIDFNDTLEIASSLYYSKGSENTEEMVQVLLYYNASNELLKMEEMMVKPTSNSIVSNVFYYKDSSLCASKQFFEESSDDRDYFVEILSYYDADEKVTLSKRRTADYEELLDQEAYKLIKNTECKRDRAMNVVNQEGEFETTFQGFVDFAEFTYLIVGEDKTVGFASSLVIQSYTPLIEEFRRNEKQMLGVPLNIEWGTVHDSGGEQQILISVRRK